MLFRMLRTQTSEHGTFRMGVAYDAGKNAAIIKSAKALVAAGLAEEVTAKQLETEKAKAEKLASAPVKKAASGIDVAAVKEAQAETAQARKEADDAKAAEAAASQVAEAAKAEAKALADRIKELEALVADKQGEK